MAAVGRSASEPRPGSLWQTRPRITTRLGPGVVEIDTLLGGLDARHRRLPDRGAARRCWSRPGSQSSVRCCSRPWPSSASAPSDLAGIAVTHIHLDHAGGVGDVARAFPNATVYVHEKGARHLVDPSRLVRIAPRWSTATCSTPSTAGSTRRRPSACTSSTTARRSRSARAHAHDRRLARPRQAPPRLHDSARQRLPVRRRRRRRAPSRRRRPAPATPPPDFDLDQAIALAGPLRATAARPAWPRALRPRRRPRRRCSTRPRRSCAAWADVAEAAWREGRDIAAALEAAFGGRARRRRPASTGRSSRRSTACTPTPPGSAAGSTSAAPGRPRPPPPPPPSPLTRARRERRRRRAVAPPVRSSSVGLLHQGPPGLTATTSSQV